MESTLKMYHQIFSGLLPKAQLNVYVNDKEYRDVFVYSKRISLVKDPKKADIILVTNESTLYSILMSKRLHNIGYEKPVLFATNYRFLDKSEDIVGAFYWRKGRSQLLLNPLNNQKSPLDFKYYNTKKIKFPIFSYFSLKYPPIS